MSQAYFRFDEFELDAAGYELRRSGHHVRLERIPMQLLILLLENPGKLVRRDAIIERIWGSSVFVEAEHGVNTAINKLRAILRDDSRNPRFIRTVVGQGYCFIAEVIVLPAAEKLSEQGFSGSPGAKVALQDSPSVAVNGFPTDPPTIGEPPVFVDEQQSTEAERIAQEFPTIKTEKPLNRKAWVIGGLIGFSVAFVIVAVAIYWRWSERVTGRISTEDGFHSVAVLPFRNLAQATDQDYMVDGMTDQLTTDLARSTSLHVISQRSAMQYKGVQKPIQEIAKALNVDAIVEGSYLREGKRVRITAQLLDARHDRHLWAQTYDESDKDLLAVQDRVTNDIAQQVAITLRSSFSRFHYKVANPLARQAYLRGRYFWNERTQASVTTSVKYFTNAIREDPKYADAYAALAEAYLLLAIYGDADPSDSLLKAQYAAERALDLDGSLGEAHTALGAVRVERDWDWSGAEKEYQRALQLNPDDPTAHHWYSLHLSRMGKSRDAEMEIQRALALDPLSLIINTDAAETAYWAREPQKALTRVESALALNSDFAEAHLTKGKILEQLHQFREAKAEFEIGKRLFGGSGYADAFKAHAMALGGERDDALKMVQQLESEWPKSHLSAVGFAMAYCGLRDTDKAMKWFEFAFQRHETGMGMIAVDPMFDGCRTDSRFRELLRRLRLAS